MNSKSTAYGVLKAALVLLVILDLGACTASQSGPAPTPTAPVTAAASAQVASTPTAPVDPVSAQFAELMSQVAEQVKPAVVQVTNEQSLTDGDFERPVKLSEVVRSERAKHFFGGQAAQEEIWLLRDYVAFHGKPGKPGASSYLYVDGRVGDLQR